MLFNSLQFAVFFAIVYSLYLVLEHKARNRLLLVASCVFYACWDWRFLSLLLVSTLLDYFCGLVIDRSQSARRRRVCLTISVCGNLGMLGFFKYCDFFLGSLNDLLGLFGLSGAFASGLDIVLPVGISFYTFQSMSYTIDVYRGQLKAVASLADFALYVSFFPQLVAGPIERASRFLPQVLGSRRISAAGLHEGGFLIFWGLFQKVMIADNLARLADPVFADPAGAGSLAVLLAVYAFAFQIYCDFAGYSNMARGLGLLMGFDIMVNFRLPYFAATPRQFWRGWHISLSTWLRDYLYIPLGGNRGGVWRTCLNLMIVMTLGGLWHGADWTFVLWGVYHGALLVAYYLFSPGDKLLARIPEPLFTLGRIAAGAVFFHLVCLGWVMFRAESVESFAAVMSVLFSGDFATDLAVWLPLIKVAGFYLGLLLFVDLLDLMRGGRLGVFALPAPLRAMFYVLCFYLMFFSGAGDAKQFIYFQF